MTGFIERHIRRRSRKISEHEYRKRLREERLQRRREIERYITSLTMELSPPLRDHPDAETFVLWMRECRRTEMYEAGRVLYEKGPICLTMLTEHQQVSVAEDYMVCMRIISRKKAQELVDQENNEYPPGPESQPDSIR
jgi:hypothetical protein